MYDCFGAGQQVSQHTFGGRSWREDTALAGRMFEVLLTASDLVRAQAKGKKKNYREADLIGKRLTGIGLTGADFRGAYLIAADMRGADLRIADMIGADLRDTDLSGTDLRKSLFLTQFQINATKGDTETRIPQALERPSHWS
ncbi:pentapeptide repeat-containing protein [Rhodococcus sp. 1168]|uniref:pentapeptide repeat-containing protein n=1 Tax=Rhodococcus sp. 1168 TaxID=2018041 RepID=UPI00267D52D7